MSVSSFIKNIFGLNVEAKYFILKAKDLITILKVSPLDSALTVGTFYTSTPPLKMYMSVKHFNKLRSGAVESIFNQQYGFYQIT